MPPHQARDPELNDLTPLGLLFAPTMPRKIPKSFPFPFDPTKRGLESFLGPTEARVLETLLERGDGTVREIQEDLAALASPTPAYTTVMTTLDRLFQKKLLDRKAEGKGYRYSPRGDRAALLTRLLGSILTAVVREASTDLPLQLSDELSEDERFRLSELLQLPDEDAE